MSWWLKYPTLILLEDIQKVTNIEIPENIKEIKNHIFNILKEEFVKKSCEVITWKENTDKKLKNNYAVIINPVFLGKLDEKIEEVLKNNKISEKSKVLREYLPEVNPPFAISIGREICKKLGIFPELHPNFINLIFIEDNINFHLLSSKTKIQFIRFLMAKLGAFKNIIVPYKNGNIAQNKVILGTLEGGHPSLDLKELAKRLMVFGSCKEVGGYEEIDWEIKKEIWQNSKIVNSMINLGNFLGEKKLLSEPVEIKDLVKDEKLLKLIVRLVNYSRQAEGAFIAFEPEIKPPQEFNLMNGIFIVTCSGKYGTVKSNLSYKDLAPIIPLKNGKVGLIKKEKEENLGPSVEAEEFTLPLLNIKTKIDLYPPIIGVVHLHRGYKIKQFSTKFFEIPIDIKDYPPVGCGVDLMQEMSKYAMKKAVELWEEKKKLPYFALFYVPNHGTNIFIFPKDNLNIYEDPFYYFKEAINLEEVVFIEDVPQV
ncbi:MAG: hypothetical protein N2Z64_05895 [Dictyoglomus thermophilum]|nr:hypothetical protein [Dictyoglomus thermophilum]MCX7720801.1 hypothetical protein [Dictyoglomus thermophilum]